MDLDPDYGGLRSNDSGIGDDPPGSNSHASPSGTPLPARPTRSRRRKPPTRLDGVDERGPTVGEALEGGWRHAQELIDYVRTVVGVRADRAALELRRKIFRLSIITAGAVAAGSVLIAASLRFVDGLAGGLTALYQGRSWLGDLTAGLLLIGLLGAAAYAFVTRWEQKELEKHEEKYERLRLQHRARHEGQLARSETPPHAGPAPRP